jgi:hypothetical protein
VSEEKKKRIQRIAQLASEQLQDCYEYTKAGANYDLAGGADIVEAAIMNALEVRWEPISLAPKDGTEVLIWDGRRRIAKWNALGWHSVPGANRCNPTHFQRLPEPPEGR